MFWAYIEVNYKIIDWLDEKIITYDDWNELIWSDKEQENKKFKENKRKPWNKANAITTCRENHHFQSQENQHHNPIVRTKLPDR